MALDMTNEQKFDAVIARYHDQVELLRTLTKIDLQIFSGFITLQLVLAGWILQHRITECIIRYGFGLLDLALSIVAIVLLSNDYHRRKEVVQTLHNLMTALHFDDPGFYVPDQPLNPRTIFRPWLPFYIAAICVTFLVMLLVLFVSPDEGQ